MGVCLLYNGEDSASQSTMCFEALINIAMFYRKDTKLSA